MAKCSNTDSCMGLRSIDVRRTTARGVLPLDLRPMGARSQACNHKKHRPWVIFPKPGPCTGHSSMISTIYPHKEAENGHSF